MRPGASFVARMLLALFFALLFSNGARAETQAQATSPGRIGILSQLVEGSWRVVGRGVPDNIMFVEWELPDRVYSFTSVTRNRRTLTIGTIASDGSIRESSSEGLLFGRIRQDGSLFFEGTTANRSVTEDVRLTGPNRFSITLTVNGRSYVLEAERVPNVEARRIAARLYPAEYRAAFPPAPRRNPSPARPAVPAPIRTALVVGIGNYAGLADLPNPANDAREIARRLTALGYRVELLIDPSRGAFTDGISRLGAGLERAPPGSSTLFYYAGHAVEIRGSNFLLPADIRIQRGADIEAGAIPLDTILAQMAVARSATRIVILDACRNAPAPIRDAGRGLAPLSAPEGTYIAYSTAPGMVAADGAGRNSPFARSLVEELGQPRQPIEAVFRSVRRAVLRATNGEQTPWDSSSLLEPFFFQN